MRTIFLFLCICSFFLSSCVKDKDVSVEIINLKLEDADNAPVYSEYSYISLETNDDANRVIYCLHLETTADVLQTPS